MVNTNEKELLLLECLPKEANYLYREGGHLKLTHTKDGTINRDVEKDFPYNHMFTRLKEGQGVYVRDLIIEYTIEKYEPKGEVKDLWRDLEVVLGLTRGNRLAITSSYQGIDIYFYGEDDENTIQEEDIETIITGLERVYRYNKLSKVGYFDSSRYNERVRKEKQLLRDNN